MTTSAVPQRDHRDVRRAGLGTAAVFFANGTVFANYVPRLPELRDQIGASNTQLGLAAVGTGLGGVIGSLAASKLLSRFGLQRGTLTAALLLAVGLSVVGFAQSPLVLALVLVFMGTVDVMTDLGMNAHAVVVQHHYERSVVNRIHGAWSIGGLTGAGVSSFVASQGVSLRVHLMTAALFLALVTLVATRWFFVDATDDGEPMTLRSWVSALRSRAAAVIGVAALGTIVIEVVGLEWGSITLRDLFDLGDGTVGLATVAFAVGMVSGRLSGDFVLDRVGRSTVMVGSQCALVVGVGMVIVSPVWPVAVAGYLVWGLGAAVLFPQLYFLSGTIPGVSSTVGLSTMTIAQRGGMLLLPAIVGPTSNAVGFRWTYVAVLGTAILALWSGLRLMTRADHPTHLTP
jgi:predicted MFS family arabinose efflux permease